jgi:hypothetical protein
MSSWRAGTGAKSSHHLHQVNPEVLGHGPIDLDHLLGRHPGHLV